MKKKIVLLGTMSRMPVGGNMWLVAQYLAGFRRLGHDVYYVEAHGITPTKFMKPGATDTSAASARAAEFVAAMMARFGFDRQWAYHAYPEGDTVYGMSAPALQQLYASADLIINLHGATRPRPEQAATGRLIYLETDPVEMELYFHENPAAVAEFVAPYAAMFTWGENYGHADCKVPMTEGLAFHPTRAPVICDWWMSNDRGGDAFTTVGNWRQNGVAYLNGEPFHWSKHHEFLRVLDLPARTGRTFELALSPKSLADGDREMLARHGWDVRDAMAFSMDMDAYRGYIQQSRAEFTVAKDQNVRLRSGWFSERSATYLAAGRPVVTQETGFSNVLPTGEGLFGFLTIEEASRAVEAIEADYPRHCRAAAAIAREYFSYDVVLPRLLADAGV